MDVLSRAPRNARYNIMFVNPLIFFVYHMFTLMQLCRKQEGGVGSRREVGGDARERWAVSMLCFCKVMQIYVYYLGIVGKLM